MGLFSGENLITQKTDFEKKALEIEKHLGQHFVEEIELMWHFAKLEERDIVEFFIKGLKRKIVEELPKIAIYLERDLAKLVPMIDPKKDLPIEKIKRTFAEILAKSLSLEEIERIALFSHENKGAIQLVRGLMYQVVEEGREIQLHIPTTFFENESMFKEAIEKGLRVLAQIIKTDPHLKDVKNISGYSDLVKKGRRAVASKGFDVELDENKKPTGFAVMSVEKLLKLYGEKEL